MKKIIPLLFLIIIGISACTSHRYENNFEFANKLAREGLWKEAEYRWKKALEDGDNPAAAHNNLAIALERQGKFEAAREEYEKALKLDPGNQQITTNLDRLKIVMQGKEPKEKPEAKDENNDKKTEIQ